MKKCIGISDLKTTEKNGKSYGFYDLQMATVDKNGRGYSYVEKIRVPSDVVQNHVKNLDELLNKDINFLYEKHSYWKDNKSNDFFTVAYLVIESK